MKNTITANISDYMIWQTESESGLSLITGNCRETICCCDKKFTTLFLMAPKMFLILEQISKNKKVPIKEIKEMVRIIKKDIRKKYKTKQQRRV